MVFTYVISKLVSLHFEIHNNGADSVVSTATHDAGLLD